MLFNVGDKVLVTGKSKVLPWIEAMDETVGKVGVVVENNVNVKVRVNHPTEFWYPSESLEYAIPEPEYEKPIDFKVGDRVYVKYGFGWDGPGTVSYILSQSDISVKLDHLTFTGMFHFRHLTLIKSRQTSDPPTFEFVKSIAVDLAKRNFLNLVTIDDVQAELQKSGYTSVDLGNRAGALFQGKNWIKQESIKSTRKGNRRTVAVWKYVGK